jgi:transposase
MRALPNEQYQYTEVKLARVNIDYHVEYQKHYYSVPHHLVKHPVELQASRDTLAVFFNGTQIARHPRNNHQGRFSTNPAHMPQAHRKQAEWTPGRLLNWAHDLGPGVFKITQDMLSSKAHPEQAYRGCLGLLNLSRKYDGARLNAACERAVAIGASSVKSIKSILQNGLDGQPLKQPVTQTEEANTEHHDNIRGPEYYH